MNKVPNLRFSNFKDEWSCKKFRTIFEELKTRTSDTEKYPLYSLTIEDGVVPKSERYEREFLVKKDDENFKIVEKDNFVYNPMNLRFGALSSYKGKKTVSVSGYYNIFKIIDGSPVSFWDNYLKTNRMLYLYNTIATGSLIEKRRVHFSQFIDLNLPVPNIDEQEKIASFFSLIDKKIELQTEKVEELKKYKKGIMQKIFSGELRFKDENGDEFPSWRKGKIHDCFLERSEKGFEDLELLSVSMERGVIKRSDIEGKDNSSENKSNYKLVKKDDIVYNSMRMWQGASGLSEYEGIVSPAYTILTPKKDIDSSYFAYLFKMYNMIYEFKKYSQGLTSDTWNLKYPQIKDIKVNIPAYEEQIKISQFFKKIDTKLNKEQEKLDRLLEYKKGLLQQMFV